MYGTEKCSWVSSQCDVVGNFPIVSDQSQDLEQNCTAAHWHVCNKLLAVRSRVEKYGNRRMKNHIWKKCKGDFEKQ